MRSLSSLRKALSKLPPGITRAPSSFRQTQMQIIEEEVPRKDFKKQSSKKAEKERKKDVKNKTLGMKQPHTIDVSGGSGSPSGTGISGETVGGSPY